MKKNIDDISCHEKAMLQVLYATFLMLFSEVENTAESTIALFSNLDVLLSQKVNHVHFELVMDLHICVIFISGWCKQRTHT